MLANMSIGRRLILAFGSVVAVFLISAAFIVISRGHNDRATARLRGNAAAVMASHSVWHEFIVEQNAVRGFVLSQADKFMGDIKEAQKSFAEQAANFRAAEPDRQQRQRIDEVEKLMAEWRETSASKQIALSRDPKTRPEAFMFVSGKYAGLIRGVLNDIDAAEARLIARNERTQAAASGQVQLALILNAVAMVAMASLMGWLLHRSIARPIVDMAGRIRSLADGDLGTEIVGQDRRDEVGGIAQSMHILKQNALERLELEQQAADARDRADAERAAAQQQAARTAAVQAEVVSSLGSGLSRLSAGDLTARLDPVAPEYEQLRRDFDAALSELQNVMKTLVSNASSLRSGVGEIAHASDDLARRTEQQAASIQETSTAIGEITGAVKLTSEGAARARTTVNQAQADAAQSENVVRDTVAAMGAIERSAHQISQIIGVIDEIAFQTNLLALNAGVEAARAGEAGRGFAVVASEVRALAQRSAEAAKEIKALITTSGEQVGRGVTLVSKTGESLGNIVAHVATIQSVIEEIAEAASRQATGLSEINSAVSQIEQVIQQNAAMVEQSTAATHSLSQEAAELESMTARFRVGDDLQQAAPKRRSSTNVAKLVRLPTPSRAKASVASDEWKEF